MTYQFHLMTYKFHLMTEPTREKTAQINAFIIAGAHEAVFANLVSKDIAKAFDGTVRGENTDISIRRAWWKVSDAT